jgi:hypothetical protein
LHPGGENGTDARQGQGVSMSGLDSLILMEDENVIMGDGDDTLEQAPAPSVVGGNDAVLVQ